MAEPVPSADLRRSPRTAWCLMLASGFAALGYQIVWTQQSTLWLGHEAAAVLAVVAAFFGGLAIGALVLGSRIERSKHPEHWYIACELLIGLWSVALAGLMAPISARMLDLIGAQPSPAWQWAVAFCGTLVVLLPATAAMGATLPAMERLTRRMLAWQSGQSGMLAGLYAANTFGAVLGVICTAFWLIPAVGLVRTAAVCAACNLLCAAGAWRLARQDLAEHVCPSMAASGNRIPAVEVGGAGALLLVLAATGLLGIGYEVLVVRVLSQVSEDTVYTFAMLLAVYLVGSASGAAFYQRRYPQGSTRTLSPPLLQDRLLCALAASSLLGTGLLWQSEAIKAAVLAALGRGMEVAISAEAVLAVLAFLLPTWVMGMLFSHLSTRARLAGIGFGRSLAVNTLGAAIAPLLFGVVLLPAWGAKAALLLVSAGYLALAAWRNWRKPMVWMPAAVAVSLAVLAPPLAFVEVPEGGHIVSYREGAMAAVSVVEDADGVDRLRINNRQQEGSSASVLADARQALLPMLLHPAPRRALFLGLGTGVTASAAAQDPMLEVDAVELLPEVIEASDHFTRVLEPSGRSPRLHVLAADARRYVRFTDQHFDLIVSDNFHPARSGSAALYTVEHFRAVRARLAQGGVFCQWLPLHQLDLATLRSILRSFLIAYPGGSAILATNSLETPVLGLVGRADGGRFDVAALRLRLASARLPHSPAEFGLDDDLALLGSFVAGPKSLDRFAGDAPANTDDHPIVAYRAPRITYAPDSLPRDRLFALLGALQVRPDEVTTGSPSADWTARLAGYWAARNRFLQAGRDVHPVADPGAMLAQVHEPLLAVLRLSPDFRPAYDPLLRIALSLARSDVAAARKVLSELERIQPARSEAHEALALMAAP